MYFIWAKDIIHCPSIIRSFFRFSFFHSLLKSIPFTHLGNLGRSRRENCRSTQHCSPHKYLSQDQCTLRVDSCRWTSLLCMRDRITKQNDRRGTGTTWLPPAPRPNLFKCSILPYLETTEVWLWKQRKQLPVRLSLARRKYRLVNTFSSWRILEGQNITGFLWTRSLKQHRVCANSLIRCSIRWPREKQEAHGPWRSA